MQKSTVMIVVSSRVVVVLEGFGLVVQDLIGFMKSEQHIRITTAALKIMSKRIGVPQERR